MREETLEVTLRRLEEVARCTARARIEADMTVVLGAVIAPGSVRCAETMASLADRPCGGQRADLRCIDLALPGEQTRPVLRQPRRGLAWPCTLLRFVWRRRARSCRV